MLNLLTSRLRGFRDDTRGYITVEAMIVMPVLLWIFGACWVYFDVFRQMSVNQKANYTIGDMISRETDPVNDTYIDNARNLLYLVDKSQGAETDLRVTVVQYNGNNNKYQVVWSEARGQISALTTQDMASYENRLPIMASNDQVVVVETWDEYSPTFQVGLGDFEIQTYSFTRPRFAPQVLHVDWMEYNNGFGNGDQDAPGGSLCNNNAENATDCANGNGQSNVEPKNRNKGA